MAVFNVFLGVLRVYVQERERERERELKQEFSSSIISITDQIGVQLML